RRGKRGGGPGLRLAPPGLIAGLPAGLDLLLVARAGPDGGVERLLVRAERPRGRVTRLEGASLAAGPAPGRGTRVVLAPAPHRRLPAGHLGDGASGFCVLLGHAGVVGGAAGGLARGRGSPRRGSPLAAALGAGRGLVLAELFFAAGRAAARYPLDIRAGIGG